MSDEEAKAKAAAAAGPAAGKTLFQKIIDREIPADIIYEDDHVNPLFSLTSSQCGTTKKVLNFKRGFEWPCQRRS